MMQPDNRPWWQKLFEGGYAGTVDPAHVNTQSTATGNWTPAPVDPNLPGLPSPGAQSNPFLTMPMDQRGSATGNGEYGIPQPFAKNPDVNPPMNPSQDDLANSRYRMLQPTNPNAPQSNFPETAPLPPARPQPPAAYASLKAPPGVNPVTPPGVGGAPAGGPTGGPGHEYYQYENDAGNLVWSTRPKGMAGAMPGTNPAGQAAQGFDRPGSGMSVDQANQFQQLRPAGSPTGAAGSGVRDFFAGLKAPPGAGRSAPPGSPQSGAPQTAWASMNGGSGTPYGPMIPEGPGQVVPSNYNENGQGFMGPGVPDNIPGAQQQAAPAPHGQQIMTGDPQSGLPSWMKGSAFGNFMQMIGMGGGF